MRIQVESLLIGLGGRLRSRGCSPEQRPGPWALRIWIFELLVNGLA